MREYRESGRRSGRTNWAINAWGQVVAALRDAIQKRQAIADHMSREAARYSTAAAPKPVADMMAAYAKQRGLRMPWTPAELAAADRRHLLIVAKAGPPNFSGPQRRRLKKKINRLMGQPA